MSVELQGYRLDVVQMRIWHVSNTGTVKMELQSPGNMEARRTRAGTKGTSETRCWEGQDGPVVSRQTWSGKSTAEPKLEPNYIRTD